MMREWQVLLWQALALTAAVLALGCGSAEVEDPPQFRVSVTLGTTERLDLQVTSEVVGTLAPWREVAVAPEIGGTVSQIEVEMGDLVGEGAVLFYLDPTDAELAVAEADAALAGAEATLREAQANHARIARIAESGVASEGDLDNAVRALAVAQAGERQAQSVLNQRREALDDCTVTAPIDGEVTRRRIEIGETLAAGTPAVDLADLSRVKFMAEVTERERVPLHVGQPVEVTVDALGGESFEGVIHALGSRADAQTLTFPVEIAIDNSDGRLLAGMIARATLLLEERPDTLVVPLGARVATITTEGAFTVVTGESGSPEARFVEAAFGDRFGDVIEVVGGVDEGMELVIRGAEGLRDGVAVRVVEGD